MKQLLNKFRNAFTEPELEEEVPQVSHRATVLNDAIRKGRQSRPVRNETKVAKAADDPRVAFIQERNQIAAGEDPYNNNDFDRADSWKNGADR
jgi:hypothetical protein